MNDKSKVALAFAFGAVVGAAVAYFLTTEKGEETIEDIKEAAGKLKNDIEANIEKGKEIIDDISTTAQTLINNIKA
jgi:gas vesicle protein